MTEAERKESETETEKEILSQMYTHLQLYFYLHMTEVGTYLRRNIFVILLSKRSSGGDTVLHALIISFHQLTLYLHGETGSSN